MLETIDINRVYSGRLFAVDAVVLRDEHGNRMQREVVRHPGAVAVVAVLREGGAERLVLIRNHRVAVGRALWEVPAGTLEAGEEPAAAAARELVEETGYRAGSVEPLGRFYTSPGFADELMHVFAADGLQWVGQRLQPEEAIEVHPVERERAIEMIAEGTIEDAKTIAAIFMWQRSRRGAVSGGRGP